MSVELAIFEGRLVLHLANHNETLLVKPKYMWLRKNFFKRYQMVVLVEEVTKLMAKYLSYASCIQRH